jgi:5-methylcytosine-specific restriction endonuclease McrA
MDEKQENALQHIRDIVDLLMPELTPYESVLYFFLFKESFLQSGALETRVGKIPMAAKIGKSSRSTKGSISRYQINVVLQLLEEKNCIKIGNTNREGTLYTVVLPRDIPLVKEKQATTTKTQGDYFTDESKRMELYERDSWTCQYCGEKVTPENVTLDHFQPKSKGGSNNKDNLRTCCLLCNSIKSGKPFEEAAPLILKSIKERKQRQQKGAPKKSPDKTS